MSIRIAPVLFALALSTAAAAASADYFLKIDTIDAELQEAEDALLAIEATDPEPVALLVPAIQKVRDAANRAASDCMTERGGDTACAADTLATLIIESDDGTDPDLSLLDLTMLGTPAKTPKKAVLFCRKSGGDGPHGAEILTEGLLLGLLEVMYDSGVSESVSGPVNDGVVLLGR